MNKDMMFLGKPLFGKVPLKEDTPEIPTPEKELVFKTEKGNPATNSLLVAEKFEMQHKNVLQSIRNLTAQNSAVRNFYWETTYVSERGRDEPIIVMNRDGFSLLVMGFTGSKALGFKLAFIDAFNKMEAMIKESQALDFSNPDTILKLAQSYKDEYDKRLLAEKKIEADKPKVDFADIVIKSDKGITVGEFAKSVYGTECGERGRNLLYAKLRALKLLQGNRREWNLPYQDYINNGWFVVDTTTYVDKQTKQKYTHKMTLITGEGQIALTEKLRAA